jgi:hypothetical protein
MRWLFLPVLLMLWLHLMLGGSGQIDTCWLGLDDVLRGTFAVQLLFRPGGEGKAARGSTYETKV